jgi:membrane-anchored glycerophosphoryl diester phosphodiesterase (GDPDase)
MEAFYQNLVFVVGLNLIMLLSLTLLPNIYIDWRCRKEPNYNGKNIIEISKLVYLILSTILIGYLAVSTLILAPDLKDKPEESNTVLSPLTPLSKDNAEND